jgi:hypothetical protein
MEGEKVPHINQNITFEDSNGNTQTGTILRTFRKGAEWWYGVLTTAGEVVEIQRGQIVERQSRRIVSDPTPEELQERIAEIQAEWTPEMRMQRSAGPRAEAWHPPQYRTAQGYRSLDYGE